MSIRFFKKYTDLPGQGTDIILKGTSKNRFKKFEVGGNTEQAQYEGKNLYNRDEVSSTWQLTKENYNNGIKLTSTVNSGVCYVSYKFPFNYDEIKNVYLNFTKTGNGFVNIYFRDENNNDTKALPNRQNPFEVTNIPKNTTQVALLFYGSTASIGDVTIFDNIQLELGTTPTSYEPYCGGIEAPNPRLRVPY